MTAPILLSPRATLPLARPARGRRRRGPMLVASAAIHLAILAALILIFRHAAPEEEPPPQGVSMVFEAAAPRRSEPSAPPRPGLPEAPRPGAMPTPTAPPVPDATAVPAPPPPPPPPSSDTQVNVQPPSPPPAPTLPDLAPAAPAPPAAAAPNPETAELPIPPPPPAAPPAPQPAPGSTQQQAALVPPLPHPPPLRAPPAQTQQHPARPAPPRHLAFPAPMNFSFGQATPATSRAPSIYSPPPPAADGPTGSGPRTSAGMLETFARAREGNPGPDFYAALRAWWLAHRFYPDQAALRGEDGDVQLSLIVDRQGRVLEVQIETRSGSQWLDMAGKSVWENARLAPIPDSLGRDRLTVDLTLHYMLIRR